MTVRIRRTSVCPTHYATNPTVRPGALPIDVTYFLKLLEDQLIFHV